MKLHPADNFVFGVLPRLLFGNKNWLYQLGENGLAYSTRSKKPSRFVSADRSQLILSAALLDRIFE